MIVPQDEEDLRRLLNVDEVPQDVREEYSHRIRFWHQAHSGPLGELGLIDLIRFCGHKAPQVGQPPVTDWRNFPHNTQVQALFEGRWKLGAYQGYVAPGTIAFESDGVVYEVLARNARLPVMEYDLPEIDKVSEPEIDKVSEDATDALPVPEEEPTSEVQYQPLPRVLVEDDDDILDGTVMGEPDDEEYVSVQIDGEDVPRVFPMSKLQFV
jgi:hypothetical protein